MINWRYIEDRFQLVLTELALQMPVAQWCHEPQGIKVTHHKTKYGMADIDGWVYVNQAFVGTEAMQLLDATIRHELAHLCAGLQHGHGPHFKAMAHEFKADFGEHLKSESAQVHAAIGYKYLLFATLDNHQEIMFRRVHRKHRKYLNYQAGRFRYLTINGQKVLSFRYQLNEPDCIS